MVLKAGQPESIFHEEEIYHMIRNANPPVAPKCFGAFELDTPDILDMDNAAILLLEKAVPMDDL